MEAIYKKCNKTKFENEEKKLGLLYSDLKHFKLIIRICIK